MYPSLTENNDENYKININEADNIKLPIIEHYLGMKFVPIPFLWHYDDFAQPFPIYGIRKITYDEMKKYTENITIPKTADFYVLAQYRKEKEVYTQTTSPNELYLSYHSWLYHNLTGKTQIENNAINLRFGFYTGIVPIGGKIDEFKFYPNKSKKPNTFGGISTKGQLRSRRGTIHQIYDHVRFSGKNVCNFNQFTDNAVFLSIMISPYVFDIFGKYNIETSNNSNCVVLHIFRNVPDNNPNDIEYQKLITEYFT